MRDFQDGMVSAVIPCGVEKGGAYDSSYLYKRK